MNFKIFKKTLILAIVACVLGSVITVVFTNLNYQKYINENNKAMLNLVSIFLESEGISKDDIVKKIDKYEFINTEILKEYGYDLETEFFVSDNEINLNKNITLNLVVVNFCVLLASVVFFVFLKRRENKVSELIFYLQQLQEKEYSLKIEENGEEELSRLQNELYKLTILLKEQAENSHNDKIQIKNNIVDISHQLKTPLTSVGILTDNMLDYPNMDEQTRQKFLQTISERVCHMEVLVQNLLKLSRFDANVIELKNDDIKLLNLILNALAKNEVLIKKKEIEVIINCDEKLAFKGDFVWQSEAISNIIKNAVEHSFQKGKIEINCSENNFTLKIAVKDFGVGIKKENLKKIFTRYYKDENSSESSLGVGLNLAKAIIEKNQGTIKASSKECTVFEISYIKTK